MQVSAYDVGTKLFFPGPSDRSFYGFYNGNAEYERQFFGNAYDSYPGSGYRHQFSSEETAVEEGEEEERRGLRESMDAFKKCGENLSNFMETFSETQKQQMAMMGQFIGAMTQFMSKNTESSPPK